MKDKKLIVGKKAKIIEDFILKYPLSRTTEILNYANKYFKCQREVLCRFLNEIAEQGLNDIYDNISSTTWYIDTPDSPVRLLKWEVDSHDQ